MKLITEEKLPNDYVSDTMSIMLINKKEVFTSYD